MFEVTVTKPINVCSKLTTITSNIRRKFMNPIIHEDFGFFETEAIEVDFISLNIKSINSQ